MMGVEPVILQIMLFTLCFLVGFVAIIIYTLYSKFITRTFSGKRSKRLMLYITDILFWLNYALFVFIVYYNVNNGRFRVFYFIIMLLGLLTAYNIKIHFYKKRNI